jgi:hypothetical protein
MKKLLVITLPPDESVGFASQHLRRDVRRTAVQVLYRWHPEELETLNLQC